MSRLPTRWGILEVKVKTRVFAAMIAMLVVSLAAQANTLVLTAVDGNLYQQTVQSPCIFSNPSCQNGTFPTTDLPTGGAVTNYLVDSVTYTGAQLLAIMGGGSMILGIDINQASGQPAQTLTQFQMLVNNIVVDTYNGTTGNVPAGNNGNGYADFILTNFSTFSAGDSVKFHFDFDDANDGTENVFIIGGAAPPPTVPEASTLMTLGLGLVLLGIAGRKIATLRSFPAKL